MKKKKLLDIRNKLKPPSNNQASSHDDQKHNVPVKSTMSSSNANRTTEPIQQPIQATDKSNLRSDLMGEFGMLSLLRKELKIMGQIVKIGQRQADICQPDASDQTA